MKKILSITIIILTLILMSCPDPLNNVVDPEAPDYQGYESVGSVDSIEIISLETGSILEACEFQTNKVVSADYYQIQMATDEEFTNLVYDKNDFTENEMLLDSPLPAGTLYLRIRAHEANGAWGPWTEIVQFNGESLIDFDQIYPSADIGNISDTTPFLDWPEVDNASGYFLEYALSEDGLDGSNVIELTSSEYTFPADESLSYGTCLYWHVASKSINGTPGFWGRTLNFNIINSNITWSGIEPSNGNSTDDTTPYINWDDISEISKYEIEFSTTSAGLDGTDIRSCNESGYQIPSEDIFSYGSTCYWHARPVYESGSHGSWSDTYYFNISSWAITWSGITPSNSSSITDTTPLFNWDDVSGAASYKIEFAGTTAGLDESDVRTATNSQYQLPSADILTMNNNFYWRIKAVDSDGIESNWSATYEFSTAIEINESSMVPANGANVSDTTPLLNWENVTGAAGYEVEFATSLSGIDGSDLISTSNSEYQITSTDEFSSGDTVYWRVRAVNGDSLSGNWSSIFHFEISWSISWSGISPTDNSTISDTTPLLNWSDVTGAVSYKIEFADSESGLNESDIRTASSSQYQILSADILAMNSSCFWRIKAIDSTGSESGWSSVYQFSTAIDITGSSMDPANGDSTDDLTPLLDWADVTGASAYEVEFAVSASSLNGSNIKSASSSAYQVSSSDAFTSGNTVYWRVRALNSDSIAGNWSSTISFSVEIPVTSLTSPSNGASLTDTTPSLYWNDVSGNSGYYLQISTNSSFTSTVYNTSTSSAYHTVTSALSDNTTYYWRVAVLNSESVQGTWSSARAFTVNISPSVTTSSASSIDTDSATCGGTIAANGAAGITSRGVCWSTSSNPTTSNNYKTSGSGTGSFTCSLTGLSADTTYYCRAFAVDSYGTYYGSQISFKTDEPAYPNINEVYDVYIDKEILIDGLTDVTDHELGEGEIAWLEIKVYNNGDGAAYDVVAKLSMESSDAAYCGIYSGDSEDTDNYIAPNDNSGTLEYKIRVDDYPPDGDLDLILTVEYEDEYGNSYTNVLSNGDLDIDIIAE